MSTNVYCITRGGTTTYRTNRSDRIGDGTYEINNYTLDSLYLSGAACGPINSAIISSTPWGINNPLYGRPILEPYIPPVPKEISDAIDGWWRKCEEIGQRIMRGDKDVMARTV